MILGFDIGNSRTSVGIFSQLGVVPEKRFHYPTEKKFLIKKTISFIKEEIKGYQIKEAIFSCSVPELAPFYKKILISSFRLKTLEISAKLKLNLKINYQNPKKLGVDRLVNAVACLNEYQGNFLIIDLGTATTFCLVLADGSFEGGLILPGIKTSLDSLFYNASHLPKIKVTKPKEMIAKDSKGSIEAGLFYGQVSLIEGLIAKIEKKSKKKLQVVLTGGFAEFIGENLNRSVIIDPFLTLKGIKYIYDLNKVH